RDESLAGRYYAPFAINSKNFTHVPEETEEWCDRCARLLEEAMLLTAQGDHADAVRCFAGLAALIEAVDCGEEIIFAEEAGSWMIGVDRAKWLKAYLTSLAATTSPADFTAAAVPLIERDSYHSFSGQAYASARDA